MKKNIIILILCLTIAGLVSCFLGHGADWDFLAYHYYNGYAALTGRVGYDIMPAGIQSYLNPLLDIFHFIIIKYLHNFPKLVSFIFGLYWGVLAFVLYQINSLLFKKVKNIKGLNNLIIFLAVITGTTECIIVSEIGMSFNDIAVAALVLSGLYFLLKSLYLSNDKTKLKLLFLSGLFAGMGAGIKLTACIYAVALTLTVIIVYFDKNFKKCIKKTLIYLLALLFGFLLINGFWMYILYSHFGNPIFPLYNAVFKSELYTFTNYNDYRFININFINLFTGPLFWTTEGKHFACELNFFDLRHSAAYFALLGLSIKTIYLLSQKKLIKSKRNIMTAGIIFFSIFSYIIWVCNFGILRYLSPILALSGTLIMLFASFILKHIKSKKISAFFLILLFLLLNYKYEYPKWGRIDKLPQIIDYKFEDNSIVYMYGKPISYLIVGQNPKARFIYLAGHVEDSSKNFMPSNKYINIIDEYKKNATQTYVIRRYDDIPEEAKKYNTPIMVKKYLDKKTECSDIHSMYKKTIPYYGVADFEVCKIIGN